MSLCNIDEEGISGGAFLFAALEKSSKECVETQMEINPHLGLVFGCCVAPAVAVVCELTSSSVNKAVVNSLVHG